MKNLYIMMIAGMLAGNVQALPTTNDARKFNKADVTAVKKAFKNAKVIQPSEMVLAWFKLEAQGLQLAAAELNGYADQVGDTRTREKWRKVAKKMKNIARRFTKLSVPKNQAFLKDLNHVDAWIKFDADKRALNAKQASIIASQVSDPRVKALVLKQIAS